MSSPPKKTATNRRPLIAPPVVKDFYAERKMIFEQKERVKYLEGQHQRQDKAAQVNRLMENKTISTFEERIIEIYKSNDTFSKSVKVFQYTFVLVAEYQIMRYLIKLRTGKLPS